MEVGAQVGKKINRKLDYRIWKYKVRLSNKTFLFGNIKSAYKTGLYYCLDIAQFKVDMI